MKFSATTLLFALFSVVKSELLFPQCFDDLPFWLNERGTFKGQCDHVAKKPKKRCGRDAALVTDNIFEGLVREYCPITCEWRPCTCEDRTSQFVIKNGSKKIKLSCSDFADDVAEDWISFITDPTGPCTNFKFNVNCPATCAYCDGIAPALQFREEFADLYFLIFFLGPLVFQLTSYPNGPWTVFAPDDLAFQNFVDGLLFDFNEEIAECVFDVGSNDLLGEVLLNHIVEDRQFLNFGQVKSFQNLLTETLTYDGVEFIEGPSNKAALIPFFENVVNGFIYGIDEVLKPKLFDQEVVFTCDSVSN